MKNPIQDTVDIHASADLFWISLVIHKLKLWSKMATCDDESRLWSLVNNPIPNHLINILLKIHPYIDFNRYILIGWSF